MIYKELICKSALNKIKKPMLPYHWDLNIYRGCGHGCQYCFAMYTHAYLNEESYFQTIYYKKNIAEILEQELSSKKWKNEVINIGGITDSYQPIEKELGLMRKVLKLMIKYKNPIIISTKSDLILRDIDLIKELSQITTVNIACTITTVNEEIREAIEPNASPTRNRFIALKRIKEETNAIVGLHLMPVIPFLTSNKSNLDAIYHIASKINIDYVLPGTLYLRGQTRNNFHLFLKKYDIEKYNKLLQLYTKKNEKQKFKRNFHKLIHSLENKYQITSDYKQVIENKILNIHQIKLNL